MTGTIDSKRAAPAPPDRETDFGFASVPYTEKKARVRGVFDSVADKYDLMNDLMSAGVHRVWKAAMIDWLAPQPGQTLLDVAGGTGDIARRFVARAEETARRRARRGNLAAAESDASAASGNAHAIICDINYEMLRAGAERSSGSGANAGIARVCGDAERLPVADRSVDAYTIAFGIRNVTDMDAALREARRVLKPGGRFMCLEFSHPITDGLQAAYDAYSFNVIPALGEAVTGDRAAYQYLVESIRKFPNQESFAARIRAAGFARVRYRNLTAGVAALHSGWRI
ncbi:MAG: bifunctional demethylmenaquinone methyltransferase/2-methoxy-6-polyprenyl-1,4-benzoquinol methylase UbiE [Parvularculaceae bacterium]